MEKIECILFDSGRIFVDYNHPKACMKLSQFSSLSPEEIFVEIFDKKLMKPFEAGLWSFEKFFEEVCRKINLDSSVEIDEFEKMWADIFTENRAVISILEKIRNDVTKLVISNADEIHWKWILQFEIFQRFFADKALHVLSHIIHRPKPFADMFKAATSKANCSYEKIVLVEDDISNLAAWKNFTLNKGHHVYYDLTRHSIDVLDVQLTSLGVY